MVIKKENNFFEKINKLKNKMSNYKQKNYACSSNETKHFSLKDKYEGSSEQVTSKKSRDSAQSKELSESTESSLDLPETQSTDEVKTGKKLRFFIFLKSKISFKIVID